MPVYKYKTTDGKTLWSFKVSIQDHQTLRRGFKTKSEALKAEDAFIHGYSPETQIITMQVLLDSFSIYYKSTFKGSSYYSYNLRRTHFLSQLPMKKSVERITFTDLKLWFDKCSGGYKSREEKLITDIKQMFEYADIYFHIHNVEYKKLKMPKDYSINKDIGNERYILSLNDFKNLYKACEDDPYWRTCFLTAFVCGLRISELRGIQIEAIDFENKTLKIYQQVGRKSFGGPLLVSPKSSNSNRIYYLPDLLIESIKGIVIEHKLKDKNFLFFGKSKNAPVGAMTVYRSLYKYQDKAGLPHFNFHTFRKSEASLLNDKGLSGAIISSYLGHESFETTKTYYIGDSNQKKAEVRNILNQIIGESLN